MFFQGKIFALPKQDINFDFSGEPPVKMKQCLRSPGRWRLRSYWFPYVNASKNFCKGKMKTKRPPKGKWRLKLKKWFSLQFFLEKNFIVHLFELYFSKNCSENAAPEQYWRLPSPPIVRKKHVHFLCSRGCRRRCRRRGGVGGGRRRRRTPTLKI